MRVMIRLAQWIRCGVLVGMACLGCGGEVALNGLAPVDAGASDGMVQDTSSNPSPGPDASIDEASSAHDAGPPLAKCGESNCHGCCDSDGYCQSGVADGQCGQGGEACESCAATSRVCSQGQCSPPPTPPTCSAEVCGGCCTADGFCAGGQSSASCGARGSACVVCSPGAVCTDGSCEPYDSGPPGPCVASACAVCIPVYQAPCCKSDQTCGCEVLFSDSGRTCQ
jgi:hypothetical protein